MAAWRAATSPPEEVRIFFGRQSQRVHPEGPATATPNEAPVRIRRATRRTDWRGRRPSSSSASRAGCAQLRPDPVAETRDHHPSTQATRPGRWPVQQEIAITGLLQQFGQRQSLLGHRILSAWVEASQLHLSRQIRWRPPTPPRHTVQRAESTPSPGTLTWSRRDCRKALGDHCHESVAMQTGP